LTAPASIWLPDAAARDAAIDLLDGVGLRAAAARPGDDDAALRRLAEAGVVAVGAGEPPAGVDAVRAESPRRALAAADRAREVASRPVFVVGAGRSGTTWVYDMLAAHPGVSGLHETRMFLPENLGPLRPGHRFEAAPRAVPGSEGLSGLGQVVDRAAVVASARAAAVGWLAEAVGAGQDCLVEKTPGHVATLDAIADLFPEARIVHVLRDVRDVLVSRRAAIRAGWWPGDRVGGPLALRTARQWAWVLDRVDAARARLPVHEVRYERLHADPAGEIAATFAFCGIPIDDGLVEEVVAANAFERHPVRGEGAFRRGGRVGDWRERLSPVDRLLVASQAGGALAERGYTERPGAVHRLERARRRVAFRAGGRTFDGY
jgi:Sulfotransferase family